MGEGLTEGRRGASGKKTFKVVLLGTFKFCLGACVLTLGAFMGPGQRKGPWRLCLYCLLCHHWCSGFRQVTQSWSLGKMRRFV